MDIIDIYIIYHFNRCLMFVDTGDSTGDPYSYGIEINTYPPVYMDDPTYFFIVGICME
jgi:hypothetical protein